MAWIELHQTAWRHRKTLTLAAHLGIKPTYAAAHVAHLWCWALDNALLDFEAHEGHLTGLPDVVIAGGADWDGPADQFVSGLIAAGWLDQRGDRLVLHDWWDYAGKYIVQRQKNAERMRSARAGHAPSSIEERAAHVQRTLPARAGATVPNSTVPNHTEQNRESLPLDQASAPREGPATPARKRGVTTSEPFLLFEAVCTELGTDVSTLPAAYKDKQCKVAQRLIGQGYTADKVLRHLHYLRSQTWRGDPIDLLTVEANIGKWELNGAPAVEATPAKPSKKADQSGIDRYLERRLAQNGVAHDTPGTSTGIAVPGGYLDGPRDR